MCQEGMEVQRPLREQTRGLCVCAWLTVQFLALLTVAICLLPAWIMHSPCRCLGQSGVDGS